MLTNLSEKEKLIYFAGLIDGEGHIGCQYYGERKRPVLQLQMTDSVVVKLFADFFGFTFRELNSPSRQNPKWKQMYQARAECQKAYPAIKKLYPYLITKKDDALIALSYYDNRFCEYCNEKIPVERNKSSKYCSKKCQIVNKRKPGN